MAVTRQEKIKKVVEERQEGIIVLEDVHDPHNVQAVVRTAEGFGFQKIYLIFEKEKVFDPKKIGRETSSSANKWVDYKIFMSTKEAIAQLKKEGWSIWATVLDKKAEKLDQVKFDNRKKIAVVFGNEHRGVSNQMNIAADKHLYIPMTGMVQSFNISVTAGIVMWEMTKQRKQTYKLNEEEKNRIEEDFLFR